MNADDTIATATSSTEEAPKFPQFGELSDDICRIIVSFIADAPYEFKEDMQVTRSRETKYRSATLTTVLPFVNKTFNGYAKQDTLWESALLRQLAHEDREHIWKAGLRRLLPLEYPLEDDANILQEVQTHLGGEAVSHKDLYKKIFTRHLKFEAPMFLMPFQVTLGEMYGLHLFEPRYRIMIRDLINGCENTREARMGQPIRPGRTDDGLLQPPQLVHFCLPQHLRPGSMACLVQVVWCRTYEYGTADVQLMPIGWVRLDRIWRRDDQGDLFYCNVTRV